MIFYLWTLIKSFYLTPYNGLAFNGVVQMRKGLRWIAMHLEMKKGVASNEMLRGAENKHRSEDS